MTATATPKRSRKPAAQPAADAAPQAAQPAAPQTEAEPIPRPLRDHTSTVIPRRAHWWKATPPARKPGEPGIPARTIRPGFSRSHCVYCGAKGPDHDQGDRGCILRKRASRAVVPHACTWEGIRKANAIFRRWLGWAARVSKHAK